MRQIGEPAAGERLHHPHRRKRTGETVQIQIEPNLLQQEIFDGNIGHRWESIGGGGWETQNSNHRLRSILRHFGEILQRGTTEM